MTVLVLRTSFKLGISDSRAQHLVDDCNLCVDQEYALGRDYKVGTEATQKRNFRIWCCAGITKGGCNHSATTAATTANCLLLLRIRWWTLLFNA